MSARDMSGGQYGNALTQAQVNHDKATGLLKLTQQARRQLLAAQQSLGSARNWGIVDILGGGLVTNLIKHGKLGGAMRAIEQVRPILREIGDTLPQVAVDADLSSGIGDFAAFADFFFDGVFADVYVQSRISDLRWQVEQTLEKLEDAASALRKVQTYEAERIRSMRGAVGVQR